MNHKHSVRIGAGAGLAVGVIMFGIGLLLRHNHVWLFRDSFYLIHAPVLRFLVDWHGAGYDWNTGSGYFQFFAALVFYWVSLGFLAGLGFGFFGNRRCINHAA